MVDRGPLKSTKTGGCCICQAYPGLEHRCMMEPVNARYILGGVNPPLLSGEGDRPSVFNWYLAQRAAKTDPEIRRILRDNLARKQEEMARRGLRPKLSQLVVPSFNRMQKLLNQPVLQIHQGLARRDRALLR